MITHKTIGSSIIEFYPEFTGFAVGLISGFMIIILKLEISPSSLSFIFSLLSQVLATLLGLILATLAVLLSLNIKTTYISRAKSNNKSADEIDKIDKTIDLIYKNFKISIALISAGTVFSFFGSVAASFSSESTSKFNSVYYLELNALFIGLLAFFIVASTLNVYSTVQTIIDLAD